MVADPLNAALIMKKHEDFMRISYHFYIITAKLRDKFSNLPATRSSPQALQMKIKGFFIILFAVTCIFQSNIQNAVSQTAGEKIILSLPKDYKVGFQEKTSARQMLEFVSKNETVEQWSKMITVQTFYNLAKTRPIDFEQKMIQNLKKGCPTAEAAHVIDGIENGYPFSLWIEKFCADATTGETETTYFKAIQGNDALYVFQKAFKAPLTKEVAIEATRFLRSTGLCDPRSTKHPCQSSTRAPQ